MYNILIAEDELIERNIVKYLIKQNQFDLCIFEACNGTKALDILSGEHIDILMTDVQMPFMNGIELADKARQLYPDIPIIFFSSHNDFSYIKRALSLRAVNYIMKPVNANEFSSTISSVLADIREKESLLMEKQKRLHIIQNHILYKLINKTRAEQLKVLYPEVNFSFIHGGGCLILFQSDRDYFDVITPEDDSFLTPEMLRSILPSNSHFINLNPAQNVLVLIGPDHHASRYEELAVKLSDYIHQHCAISCRVAISGFISSLEDLPSAYEETERKLMDDITLHSSVSPLICSSGTSVSDDEILNQIRSDIQFKDSVRLRSHIRLLINNLRNTPKQSQIYFRFQCTSVLKLLLTGFPPEKEKHFDEYATVISRSVHLAPIETLILSLTDELAVFFDEQQTVPQKTLVQVKQYIRSHYAEDLSLELLAKSVFLSPGYLSALFIEHNGYGINKYIKKVRMEKAQEMLLNTEFSVNEISKRVGYTSTSYFYRSFFKDFGVTPDKFRIENRNASERTDC